MLERENSVQSKDERRTYVSHPWCNLPVQCSDTACLPTTGYVPAYVAGAVSNRIPENITAFHWVKITIEVQTKFILVIASYRDHSTKSCSQRSLQTGPSADTVFAALWLPGKASWNICVLNSLTCLANINDVCKYWTWAYVCLWLPILTSTTLVCLAGSSFHFYQYVKDDTPAKVFFAHSLFFVIRIAVCLIGFFLLFLFSFLCFLFLLSLLLRPFDVVHIQSWFIIIFLLFRLVERVNNYLWSVGENIHKLHDTVFFIFPYFCSRELWLLLWS